MGIYTLFYIVFRTDIFRNLSLGAPDFRRLKATIGDLKRFKATLGQFPQNAMRFKATLGDLRRIKATLGDFRCQSRPLNCSHVQNEN